MLIIKLLEELVQINQKDFMRYIGTLEHILKEIF